MANDLKVAVSAKVNSPNRIEASISNIKIMTHSAVKATCTPIIHGTGESNHALLRNLDYDNSGHTGFASQKELQNYAKQTELPETLSNLEIENILK